MPRKQRLPAAGWYADPENPPYGVRFWGGKEWTSETASHACTYCFTPMIPEATRCTQCGGEHRRCSKCQRMVGVRITHINVGLARGGRAEQVRCNICGRVMQGPVI